ncbi:amino acid ABC transporter permease [Kaustia mangrovi]|uniref:Amino acid ABC transporter permease n=1 Tax=Kaustia mangrovi TaxID=2593653 RepID=A0A7S8HAL9_9HYPH|nr:amino acid ABC transporter permease [Kaustia mangrovi]QPC41727.1 amino acid ABC transporter permease [Kaustia mangrovi]
MSVATQEVRQQKSSIWNDPRFRSLLSQVLLIAAVIWLGWEVISNTMRNLEQQNIASGFGFLDTTAGFGINQSLITYSEESSYGRVFVVGLLNTILVSFLGIILATIIGFVVGVMRLSKNWLIAKIAAVYVEVLRNIPLLLQIFFWYFAVLRSLPSPRASATVLDSFFVNNRGLYVPRPLTEPGFQVVTALFLIGIAATVAIRIWAKRRQDRTGQQFPVLLTGLGLIVGLPVAAFLVLGSPVTLNYPQLKGFNFVGGLRVIPEFVAMLLALSIYTAAFIAEIVRAGILAVSKGQTEAASALGLRPRPTLRLVVVPQAVRVIIPPLTNQYLNLTKNSSLAVAIAYPELVSVFAGTTLNQTGQAVEIILMTMAVYLTLSLLTSAFMNWYNAKMALVER